MHRVRRADRQSAPRGETGPLLRIPLGRAASK
ncbi:hypothetical protein SGPA1_10790 [Streptomyces misionensis JCM 4497]